MPSEITEAMSRDERQSAWAALRMIRDAIGELFGVRASIESEEAVLLRGPEYHHEAEAIIAALQRLAARPAPEAGSLVEAIRRILAPEAMGRDHYSGGTFIRTPDSEVIRTLQKAAATLQSQTAAIAEREERIERLERERDEYFLQWQNLRLSGERDWIGRAERLEKALRHIAECNLREAPWDVARAALQEGESDVTR